MYGIGLSGWRGRATRDAGIVEEQQLAEITLHRALRYTGYKIEDLVHDPYARFMVFGYYRLYYVVRDACAEVARRRKPRDVGKFRCDERCPK